MQWRAGMLRRTLIRALALYIVAYVAAPPIVGAVGCSEELAKAEQSYHKGQFEEAIALLEGCLDKPDLPRAERRAAYRLLGLTYLAQDFRDKARTAVKQLLQLVPDYQPDLDQDPPPFVSMVNDVRAELSTAPAIPAPVSKPHRKPIKKILIIAGTILTGGLLAVVLSGGGNEPTAQGPGATTISPPPDLPER